MTQVTGSEHLQSVRVTTERSGANVLVATWNSVADDADESNCPSPTSDDAGADADDDDDDDDDGMSSGGGSLELDQCAAARHAPDIVTRNVSAQPHQPAAAVRSLQLQSPGTTHRLTHYHHYLRCFVSAASTLLGDWLGDRKDIWPSQKYRTTNTQRFFFG